jgi:hypothetical protein
MMFIRLFRYRSRNRPDLVARLNKRLRDVDLVHESDLIQAAGRSVEAAIQSIQAAQAAGDDGDGDNGDNDVATLRAAHDALQSVGPFPLQMGRSKLQEFLSGSDPFAFEHGLSGEGMPLVIELLGADYIQWATSGAKSDSMLRTKDPFVRVAEALYPLYVRERDSTRALLAKRDELLAKLLELQREHASEGEIFWPDCNSSLRFSAGHVEG